MKKILFTILTISISTLTYSQVIKNNSNNTISKIRTKIESIDRTSIVKKTHSDEYYEKLYDSKVDSLNKVWINLHNITKRNNPKPSDINAKKEVENKIYEKILYFIIDNPNCITSVNLLNQFKKNWGKEITNELFNLMNKETQESVNGKNIALFIELKSNLKIGSMYADFEQENVNGKKIKISNIRGKYTLIDFWASWCAPCRAVNPFFIKEFKKYKNKGFQIIGVSLDSDKKAWVNAIEKDKLPWKNISDLNGLRNQAALIYDVYSIPDNILIDENGIIIGRHLSPDSLKIKLKELFKE